MTKRVSTLVAVCALVACVAAGGVKKIPGRVKPVNFTGQNAQSGPLVLPIVEPPTNPVIGTPTGLSGFYDYQSNGGSAQYIRTNPANGAIHVTYMLADDSASTSASRRVGYAYSTNNGSTWNTFGNLRVPARRAGFPSLDLLQGANAGSPVLANHNDPGTGLVSLNYVDSPPGSGAFSELNPVTPLGGDEPIWPYTAGTSNGGVVFVASRSAGGTAHITRTTDFTAWEAWRAWPPPNNGDAGGRYPIAANTTGRVGIAMNYVDGGIEWLESTNSGQTWPASATRIHDSTRIVGADTFQAWVDNDVVYNGNNALHVIGELNIGANEPTDGAQIVFWSQATGYRVVARKSTTPNVLPGTLNRAQVNHLGSIGYPSIGMSGTRIVVVFMGFRADTSAQGWNYGEIYWSQSADNGNTWSTPVNLTVSPTLDDRYPHVSKWNPSGFANIVWQEDPVPGAHAFNDGAPVSRSRQMFQRVTLTDVRVGTELPITFKLQQNYPNPFNPSTNIRFSLPTASNVALKVFNTAGQEVATLVEGYREAGNYEHSFDASQLASGVYYYRLKAGNFIETRKMILTK
jgi:hypothetical protein